MDGRERDGEGGRRKRESPPATPGDSPPVDEAAAASFGHALHTHRVQSPKTGTDRGRVDYRCVAVITDKRLNR